MGEGGGLGKGEVYGALHTHILLSNARASKWVLVAQMSHLNQMQVWWGGMLAT